MDEGWRTSMLSYLEDDSSFAGQTLMKLGEYKEKKDSGWREHGADALDHVVILPRKAGLTLDLEFHPIDARNKPEQASIYISSEDRAAMYVKTLDPDTLDRLALLGYGRKEIIDTYLLAESVTDEDFIDCVMKAEYRDAFRTDPEELGKETKLMLPLYALKLCQIRDTEGGYTELESFLNNMLYRDKEAYKGYYYTDNYVTLMAEQSGLLKWNGREDIRRGKWERDEYQQMIMMDGFWRSLYAFYCEGDTRIPPTYEENIWYSRGECMLQVRNLDFQNSQLMCYDIVLCNEDGSRVYKENAIEAEVEGKPLRASQKKIIDKLRQLDERIDMLVMEQMLETGICVMDIFLPNVAEEAAEMLEGGGPKFVEFVKGMESTKLAKLYRTDTANGIKQIPLGFIGYYEKKRNLEMEKNEIVQNELVTWFYSSSTYSVDGGEEIYSSESISDYDVIMAVDRWDKEGLASFIDPAMLVSKEEDGTSEETLGEELIRLIDKDPKVNSEYSEAMKFLAAGKNGETKYESVLEMEGELFMRSVNELDAALGRYFELDPDFMIKEQWMDLFREDSK